MHPTPVHFLRLAACAASALPLFAQAASNAPVVTGVEVTQAISHDHLPSLRGVMPKPDDYDGVKHDREWKKIPHIDAPGFVQDAAAQSAPVSGAALTTA